MMENELVQTEMRQSCFYNLARAGRNLRGALRVCFMTRNTWRFWGYFWTNL